MKPNQMPQDKGLACPWLAAYNPDPYSSFLGMMGRRVIFYHERAGFALCKEKGFLIFPNQPFRSGKVSSAQNACLCHVKLCGRV